MRGGSCEDWVCGHEWSLGKRRSAEIHGQECGFFDDAISACS